MPEIVLARSSVAEVQEKMKWHGTPKLWKNFLKARNSFVDKNLTSLGLSVEGYRSLEDHEQRRCLTKLEKGFLEGFFIYSRDEPWMADVVGDCDWIDIEGIISWHVLKAITALELAKKPATSANLPAVESQPIVAFDAVKDAAKFNDRM